MLTCKDYATDKGSIYPYTRLYFAFASTDPKKLTTKTVDGKVVASDREVPANDATAADPKVLLGEALQWLQQEFPATDEKPAVDPLLILLDNFSTGVDFPRRQAVRPTAPVDLNKAYEGMAKKMVAAGKFADVPTAIAALKALGM